MAKTIYGSINLSAAKRAGQIKQVTLKDGTQALFLQIAIIEKKTPQTFVNSDGRTRTYTHFVTCAPKQDQQVQGVNYYIGDLQTYDPDEIERRRQEMQPVTTEQIVEAPAIVDGDDTELPF